MRRLVTLCVLIGLVLGSAGILEAQGHRIPRGPGSHIRTRVDTVKLIRPDTTITDTPIWEQIQEDYYPIGVRPDEQTYRSRVPGGWIVKVRLRASVALVFVPDPNHFWKIKKE
ncbi:hypothetical protein KW796_00275 [Candidatus Parcubacteria bacterium]|nr:hypothetical protein [Candidatus Parcubacteria bacterium]